MHLSFLRREMERLVIVPNGQMSGIMIWVSFIVCQNQPDNLLFLVEGRGGHP